MGYFSFAFSYVFLLILCLAGAQVNTAPIKRNYIKEAVVERAIQIGAVDIAECVEQVSSRRNFNSHTAESIIACVCAFKEEVVDRNDPRFVGLSQSCKKATRMPVLNPYDSHFNIKTHCSSYGANKHHPMCALF